MVSVCFKREDQEKLFRGVYIYFYCIMNEKILSFKMLAAESKFSNFVIEIEFENNLACLLCQGIRWVRIMKKMEVENLVNL